MRFKPLFHTSSDIRSKLPTNTQSLSESIRWLTKRQFPPTRRKKDVHSTRRDDVNDFCQWSEKGLSAWTIEWCELKTGKNVRTRAQKTRHTSANGNTVLKFVESSLTKICVSVILLALLFHSFHPACCANRIIFQPRRTVLLIFQHCVRVDHT